MIIQKQLITLDDWKDFISEQSAIDEIAKSILRECDILPRAFERINIGTNAVFDLGDTVLKIYASYEEAQHAWMDCRREITMLNMLKNAPFRVPSIIRTGYICDRYKMYYNILEKFNVLHPFFHDKYTLDISEYNTCIQELHKVIQVINNIPINTYIAQIYSKPLRNFNKDNDEYARYLKIYFRKNAFNLGVVHGDLSETNIYLDHERNTVVLDFEDWMYAPIIVEYPTICFELLKTPQNIQSFFNYTSLNKLIEMLIAGVLLHNESNRFLKNISLQMGKPDEFPTISDLYSFFTFYINN